MSRTCLLQQLTPQVGWHAACMDFIGVWCVVCGVWCVVCGVWCVVCGVWCVVCGVWCVPPRAWETALLPPPSLPRPRLLLSLLPLSPRHARLHSVPPWQYAKDIAVFTKLVASQPAPPGWARPPLALAADVDFIPETGDFGFQELLADAARANGVTWDVATWHFCELWPASERSCWGIAPAALLLWRFRCGTTIVCTAVALLLCALPLLHYFSCATALAKLRWCYRCGTTAVVLWRSCCVTC
jgi:hypothetical protein